MAITVVQTADGAYTVGPTTTFTLSAAPTVGNTLIWVFRNSAGNLINYSDKVLDATAIDVTRFTHALHRAVQSGDGTSWSLTCDVGTATTEGFMWEVSGLDNANLVDKVTTGTAGTFTSIAPGASGTLSKADEFAVAAAGLGGTSGGGQAVTDGFNLRLPANHDRMLIADKTVSTTTSLNPTFSWTTSRRVNALMVTYRASDAPPVSPVWYVKKNGVWVAHDPILL